MDTFNIEYMFQNKSTFTVKRLYQNYLSMVNLDEDHMHPEQKKQLRQTFFGACGQLIVLFHDELSKLSDKEAVETIESMLNEITFYFLHPDSE